MPQIQVFQCPSCGANQSYDGGPELSFPCQFCGATVVVPEALRPTGAPASAPTTLAAAPQPGLAASLSAMADLVGALPTEKLAELQRLARSGQRAHAVRLYREIFDTSLMEASQAVDRLADGQPLVVPSTPVDVSRSQAPEPNAELAEVARLARAGQQVEALALLRRISPGMQVPEAVDTVHGMARGEAVPIARRRPGRAARAGAVLGCSSLLVTLLIVGGSLAFVAALLYLPFRLSGSFKQALAAAQADPEVIEALGAPVEAAWWPGGGEISCGGSGCSANYTIPLQGSRATADMRVMSDSRGASFLNEGAWVLDAAVRLKDGRVIRLTEAPPLEPTPTLSALDADATAGAEAKATRVVELTQTAKAEATQTARQAGTATAEAEAVTATAEAVETAAAQARALATAEAVGEAQAQWPAVLTDQFTGNQLGWPIGPSDDDYFAITTTVKGGKYAWQLSPKRPGYAFAYPLNPKPYTDFSAAVAVTFVSGAEDNNTAAGLVFRRRGQQYGFFGVDPSGLYRVFLMFPGSGAQIQMANASELIKAGLGEVNQLTARGLGPHLVFEVNGSVIYQIALDLPPGDFGLGVHAWSEGEPVSVEFTDFVVRAPKK
jgi:hypothetical protein